VTCFSKNNNKCKECVKAYNKQYRLSHKEEAKQYRIDHKEETKQYNFDRREKTKQYNKQYQLDNKEELKIYKKQYRSDNKEKIKYYGEQYRADHKDQITQYNLDHKEYRKQYRKAHKERDRIYKKQYRLDHREEIRERDRQYTAKNKGKIKQYQIDNKEKRNARETKRRQSNIIYKLRLNVSSMINMALKRSGGSKRGESVMEYLPYIIEDLKQHIEDLFDTSWMTWDNHGVYNTKTWFDNDKSTWTWQLDHITPQSKLPFTSMEEENFQKCWALDNLRPYSAKQNILDGNRR
jgi:hypothetical protein